MPKLTKPLNASAEEFIPRSLSASPVSRTLSTTPPARKLAKSAETVCAADSRAQMPPAAGLAVSTASTVHGKPTTGKLTTPAPTGAGKLTTPNKRTRIVLKRTNITSAAPEPIDIEPVIEPYVVADDTVTSSTLTCCRTSPSDVITRPLDNINVGMGPPLRWEFLIELVLAPGTDTAIAYAMRDSTWTIGVRLHLDVGLRDVLAIVAHLAVITHAQGPTRVTWAISCPVGVMVHNGSLAWDVVSAVDSYMRSRDCPSFAESLLCGRQNMALATCISCGIPTRLLAGA